MNHRDVVAKKLYFMLGKSLPVLLLLFVEIVLGNEHSHRYSDGEDVVLWMNTVGPYANRQETYEYYQLPYCAGTKELSYHRETFGEALQGMNLVNSGFDIHFKQNLNGRQEICPETHELTQKQVNLFRFAVANKYWFTAYIDDLPIGGFVGEQSLPSPNGGRSELYLFTHQSYHFEYNGDRLISANVTMESPILLEWKSHPFPVRFTYSVDWKETTADFETRFEKYLDSGFFEHKIHWVSIFNSLLMIMFLIALIAIIFLRVLRRDLKRYDKDEGMFDLDRDMSDESGWKLIHGDVFRAPQHLSWVCALVGTGSQLFVIAIVVMLYTITFDSYEERSKILNLTLLLYILTSLISGYRSGSLYAQYGGRNKRRCLITTAALFPGIIAAISLAINVIAIVYASTKAIPFGLMIQAFLVWLLIILPLTYVGMEFGRKWNNRGDFPTRIHPIPRPIPDKKWYTEPFSIILFSGLLPFGSIFIEMYFVFTSFWAYKIYYVYGFLLLVFAILCVVTACSTIVACYVLLNAEDHRWHWVTFYSGGSVAIYIFLYSIHYFFARTKMFGLFQTAFYFGYTLLICFVLFTLCGAIGYWASSLFVRKIYSTVKID